MILLHPVSLFAQSEYVLPYPSAMPGNKLYGINRVVENISRYWSFGTIAGFKNSLRYSDKYLVEAKILFEYKQYLLASVALERSNHYFQESEKFLTESQKKGKDISEKKTVLSDAAEKHIEVLAYVQSTIPENFKWTPEKGSSTYLDLEKQILNSISLRDE